MSAAVPRIKRLDQTVVNRIAAGEVIHRPANAVKELLENSLDAGSTQIQITLKDGGLKLLQIQDNGHGIDLEDMPVVCERFTTSKLQTYDDLASIATFGFRGEALASISHVSHLSITTKTAQSQLAYNAHYADGRLVSAKPGQLPAEPRPCAGNNGTLIVAEDLFYNVPTRRKALINNPNEEYNRVLDVCSRYAVHNAGVSISCRKQGSASDLCTATTAAAALDNIRQIYGGQVAKELLELSINENSDRCEFNLTGYVSNANFHQRRLTLILFINNRLVESSAIKRMLESVYAAYLPKGQHPWAYLSLTMPPDRLDVNVHPTKREVHLLNQSVVIDAISTGLLDRLMATNASRLFTTQTIETLAAVKAPLPVAVNQSTALPAKSLFSQSKPSNPSHLVRTDSRTRTLHSFFPASISSNQVASAAINPISEQPMPPILSSTAPAIMQSTNASVIHKVGHHSPPLHQQTTAAKENISDQVNNMQVKRPKLEPANDDDETAVADEKLIVKSPPYVPLQTFTELTSVRELLDECAGNENKTITTLLRNHVFVGVADSRRALVQHEKNLYLLDFHQLSRDLAYQMMLERFETCKRLHFTEQPLELKQLLDQAARATLEPADVNEENVQELVDFLESKSEMLQEYFSITIQQGQLLTIPLLLDDGYRLCMDKLPMFLLRLALEVDWEEEKSCFGAICWELALFYAAEPSSSLTSSGVDEKEFNRMIEHVLFPALRYKLCAQRNQRRFQQQKQQDDNLAEPEAVVMIAQLPELYKIFERC